MNVAWLRMHGCAHETTFRRVVLQFMNLQQLYMQKLQLKTWFDFIDADGSGEIDVDELEDPLTSLGLATTRDEVQRLVEVVDADNSGEIGFEEFVAVITTQHGTRNPIKKLYVNMFNHAGQPSHHNVLVCGLWWSCHRYMALASGELGDRSIHLSVLIAAFRFDAWNCPFHIACPTPVGVPVHVMPWLRCSVHRRSVILNGLNAYGNPNRTHDQVRALRVSVVPRAIALLSHACRL